VTIEDTVALAEARVRVANGDLLTLRRRAGLSQEAIGRAVGATRTTVLRWEHLERVPSGPPAIRLAQLMRELDKVVGAGRRGRRDGAPKGGNAN
jgi:transcriptional regulator with XRE-family HTH domain